MAKLQETKKLIEVKAITGANYVDLAPQFSTLANLHNAWEMVYVNAGQITCHMGKKKNALSQGQVIFHRPGELHSTTCNGKNCAAIFSLIFESPSPKLAFFDGRVTTIPNALLSLLSALISESNALYLISSYPLTRRPNAPVGSEQVVLNYLENFLILLLRAEKEKGEKASSNKKRAVRNALADEICLYLRDHVYDHVSLDELSARFHFGKVYLCDLFKENIGSTITAYHLDLKIGEAKRMLRETDASVAEISDALGFESPSYFSRRFKKHVGHPPQAFRRMLSSTQSPYNE